MEIITNYTVENTAPLLPLYVLLKTVLLQSGVLHGDETTAQVIKEPGREAKQKSYMWLYRTSRDASRPIALYEYTETREANHPQKFLEGFSGWLHTDGYAGYRGISDVKTVGCWAHMRRYFEDALGRVPTTEMVRFLRQFFANRGRFDAACQRQARKN